jgi:DNA polymerase
MRSVQKIPSKTSPPKTRLASPKISAADFLPARNDLPSLRAASRECRGCDLYRNATQTVFGEGRASSTILFVGEQPGDQEDLAGRPFVGPAGRLLDACMEEAGIDRDAAYVTNAVKHFKWEPRGKRRIHKNPTTREVAACRPWLTAEMEAVDAKLIVCLGATAAQSLLGSSFRVTQDRGKTMTVGGYPPIIATIHPSAVLRAQTDEDRERERRQFVADLVVAARVLHNG